MRIGKGKGILLLSLILSMLISTASCNENGQLDAASPFYTGYFGFCGEKVVQGLLKTIREKDWIAVWNEESKAALLGECLQNGVRVNTELYLSQSPAQALQGFFESCCGPVVGWTDALWEQRDSVFTEYGLVPEETPFHVSGVRRISRRRDNQTDAIRTYTLFDGGEYKPPSKTLVTWIVGSFLMVVISPQHCYLGTKKHLS